MKKPFLILLLILSPYVAFTQQIRQFTADTVQYVQEIRNYTNNYISSEESLVIDKFISYWQSGTFTWEEMSMFAANSTLLVRKNARPSPHFVRFLELLTILYSDELNEKDIGRENWQKTMDYLLTDRNITLKTIDMFLKASLDLIKNNELYSLPGNIWKGIDPQFHFTYAEGNPRVVFDDFDLVCYSKRDSIMIFKTSGELDITTSMWFGKGGIITWERAGLSRDEVYARLGNFKIDLKRSEYTADSVLFTYKKYFDQPMGGRFEDKVMVIPEPERATYPKFFSYQNKFFLPDLFNNIEYIGGLSMQGGKLLGTGTTNEPAVLNVFDNGLPRMKIEADQLLISSNGVNSPGVRLTLYIETDSVYHPDLQFSFNESLNELRFTKSRSYTSASPYTNTYHDVDMNFEEFYWKRNERIIRFRPLTGTAIGVASFESNTFFNYRIFEDLQGMDNINPLVALWQFGRASVNQRFPVSNYARYLGMELYQVRQQLMRLSRLGFIFFDDEADIVTLRPKLFYFLDASVGKTDYDVILFSSRTQAPLENALLNLDNYDLTINGIPNIFLSDSQNVVLLPSMNQITMKRNKSFQFNGVIHAGLFSFYGNNFFFEYDNFKINLQNIDSIGLAVNTGEIDNTGRLIAEKINNLLEDATGELFIDDPNNKSGLKSYPQYPVFNSFENSYVYFDEPEIQNGVYQRNDVYFKVDPFKMDSLDNFLRNGMRLSGEFISGGILPPLDQTLILMPDNSLGFRYNAPDLGIPVYDGKGTFYQNIELSNRGLRGSGKLEYLTSLTLSDNFLFHPDSLMTISRDFTIDKQYIGTEFPQVRSKNNNIKWLTKQDQFFASTQDIPFTMFADTIKQSGDILLQPGGLTGKGNINMVSASLSSDNFNYKADQIFSDTADFKLLSTKINKLAFSTENVRSHIDFKNLEGEFRSNEGYTQVEFPENRFISKLDFFIWLIDEEQLHMGLDKPITNVAGEDGLEGPRYISVHPKQDSLSFVSPIAVYDYKNFIIKATDVPYIQVADARIFPVDGLVVIEPGALIRTLKEAKIVASYTNEYFTFYDASVDIKGKYDYSAAASYDYLDETGIPQVIKFNQINVNPDRKTAGQGEVTIMDSFQLSPHFDFQGKIRCISDSPLLTFDGATRIKHDCPVGRSWLKFSTEIDPLNVMIPVSEAPVDINLSRIYAGMMLTRDSAHVYSTYFSSRKDYFDAYLSTASGYLTYDRENNWYEIAELNKLADSTSTGNYLRLTSYPCFTYSEGKIDYLVNYGQLKMSSFGKAIHDPEKDEFVSDVFIAFDFFFSPEALNVFASELDSLPGLKAYDITNPVYRIGLSELVGLETARTMTADVSLYGSYRTIPDSFKKTMILSNVNLKWNFNTRSFRYHGNVGVIRIGEKQINKQVEVYIELSKRSSGDLFDIYFVLNDRIWYYFGYNPGSFQVTSSNSTYNNIIFSLKDNQRKMSVGQGAPSYIYALAPERRAQLFLRRYLDEENN